MTPRKGRKGREEMKNVLAVVGSPRKLGNCEIAAKLISREISEPHELNLLRLADFQIRLCTGCYTCLFKNKCVIKDDLPTVIDAFAEADAFIIAAPTYCLGANASLKLLADRLLAFHSRNPEIWGKPAVGIGVAGMEGKEGATKLNLDSFMRLFQMQIKASRILYAAMPGEIALSETNRRHLQAAAGALFREAAADEAPRCPLCGGDTFRFYPGNRVRCMLCSNSGHVEFQDGLPVFAIERSSHELLLSREDAIHHGEWLMQMKEKFKEEKTRLKAISQEYAGIGRWITPPAGRQ